MMVLQPRAAPWVSGVQCVHTCNSLLCSCLQEEEDTSETAVAILMTWPLSIYNNYGSKNVQLLFYGVKHHLNKGESG